MIEEQEKPEEQNAELESPEEPTEPTGEEEDAIDDGCGKQPVKGGN